MPRYNPAEIEPRWQRFWEQNETFQAPPLPAGEKLYVLDMFPYPSGDGLHVGHPEGYTATDIVCRHARMNGKSVMHPMGFDAFGLPAEEHAIKTSTPPRESTERNIATFRRQLKMLGFSYDWSRELATTDVEYFRWTQWIFLVLFDTWYDEKEQRGRPISGLPIPADVQEEGAAAVREFIDERRLAYQSDALVNWCPALGTVLANEEVQDGKSEVGGHPVQRIPLKQWMLRITAYAPRLLADLDSLDWSASIKTMQREWIGKSTGAEVDFYIGELERYGNWKTRRQASGFPRRGGDDVLRIYTTRPDTLFGATYMVIAPEHPFAQRLTTSEHKAAVEEYCRQAAGKSDLERSELSKEKTGVFTGSCAVNPLSDEPIPIWIADYVLIGYGTGAIMAVPAHDERDFQFARQFDLPIVPVVDPGEQKTLAFMHTGGRPRSKQNEPANVGRDDVLAGKACFAGPGTAINSGKYGGLATDRFIENVCADLTVAGLGRKATNFKLRDWLFSRQRFWGEPFPILHRVSDGGRRTGEVRAVDPADLPIDLPQLADYKPHGRPEPPLEKAPDDWLYVTIDGKRYKRETNTMPQWAGSCWYFLRFIDPKNEAAFVDAEREKAWMPVDLYIGGAEHAVLHLLYARFWHKVLYDRGHVSTKEPFQRLVNQGMILGEMEHVAYRRESGEWVSAAEVNKDDEGSFIIQRGGDGVAAVTVDPGSVEKQGDSFVLKEQPEIRVESRAYKMSKSRGNVVNPDEIVREYGADALRLFEMFMGPLEATKPWSMAGVSGVRNFLDRVWRMIADEKAEELALSAAVQDIAPTAEQNRVLHQTIQAVSRDIEQMTFNTAIARMMEFVNYFTKQPARPREAMESFVLLLSPYAPHIAEELWRLLGHDETLAYEPWPRFDAELAKEDSIEIPIQIKGKVRCRIRVAPGISRQELEAAARADDEVAALLAGKEVVKTIVVPGRLVNFVIG